MITRRVDVTRCRTCTSALRRLRCCAALCRHFAAVSRVTLLRCRARYATPAIVADATRFELCRDARVYDTNNTDRRTLELKNQREYASHAAMLRVMLSYSEAADSCRCGELHALRLRDTSPPPHYAALCAARRRIFYATAIRDASDAYVSHAARYPCRVSRHACHGALALRRAMMFDVRFMRFHAAAAILSVDFALRRAIADLRFVTAVRRTPFAACCLRFVVTQY